MKPFLYFLKRLIKLERQPTPTQPAGHLSREELEAGGVGKKPGSLKGRLEQGRAGY